MPDWKDRMPYQSVLVGLLRTDSMPCAGCRCSRDQVAECLPYRALPRDWILWGTVYQGDYTMLLKYDRLASVVKCWHGKCFLSR